MIDCSKTANYLSEKLRMTEKAEKGLCKLSCFNCPLGNENNGKGISCVAFEMFYPKKAIEAVQKWSDEHPQRTYLSELLKIFPNIPLSDDGTPKSLCPFELGVTMTEKCNNECIECWNQPISIEDGEE